MSMSATPTEPASRRNPESAHACWPPPFGGQQPLLLTPAYCADRSAAALLNAETAATMDRGDWLVIAAHWRELGVAIATNFPMIRTVDDREAR